MKNWQQSDLSLISDVNGIGQVIGFLIGAGGALKLASVIWSRYMDRRMKLDDYAHQGSSDFTARVWAKLESQEKIIHEQNLEIDKKNEVIFDIKLKAELLERRCEQAIKDLTDMKTVNEFLKHENEDLRRRMPPSGASHH